MKWFKHDSNAMNDPRVRLLRVKYGMEGYGVYFGLLEMIASEVTENSPSKNWGKLSEMYNIDFLSAEFRIEKKKLTSIISYMSEIGLIDESCWAQSKIANFKILVRADEYTQKLLKKSLKNPKIVGSESGLGRDKVGSESGKNPENVGLEEEVEIEIEVESEKEKKSDTPKTSPPKKFTCSSQEITEWVNSHSGFYNITPQCIEALLEEFTDYQILDRLKACNSWIISSGRKVTNTNMTLNKFMDDCRRTEKPDDDEFSDDDYPYENLTQKAREMVKADVSR